LRKSERQTFNAEAVPESASKSSGISIDSTAGQKTFSIASAIFTLNNEILLSYVTNEGKPKYYDMSASFGGASV